MRRIKIAQIGIGHDHGGSVLKSIIRQDGIFELVGFGVPEAEKTVRTNFIR